MLRKLFEEVGGKPMAIFEVGMMWIWRIEPFCFIRLNSKKLQLLDYIMYATIALLGLYSRAYYISFGVLRVKPYCNTK
jgi:hypothetical protein